MVWPILFAAAAVLLAAAVTGCAWLVAERRSLRQERQRLADDLSGAQTTANQYADENSDLLNRLNGVQRDLAVAQERIDAFDSRLAEKDRQFAEAQKQARDTFQSLAGEQLERANKRFLELANENFAGKQKDAAAELDQRRQAISSMLKPIRETLDKYNQAIRQVETARKEAYGSLRTQVGALLEDQRRLREETSHLVQALRRPEVRGRWGEMQLRRVAELAGMIRYCDFEEQPSLAAENGGAADGESGRLQPDMVVNLPSQRKIVVDAKTPINAFIDAAECDDDQQRQACLQNHVRHIETQIKKLSAKQYQQQFDRSPDFVVLFIPGESFLQAAVQIKPELIESAMQSDVLIASPTTLISLLKAVAVGWREQQIAENARHISNLGMELHERIATATSHIEKLGGHLEKAVKSYNQFVGSFESRVLVSARKFKELGADSSKELPASVDAVENTPRGPVHEAPESPSPQPGGVSEPS